MGLIKSLLLITALNVSSPASVFAQVQIANSVVPATEGLKHDQYICLGNDWHDKNIRVHVQLEGLIQVYPELFHSVPTDGAPLSNCFSPTEIPYGAQSAFDQMLADIDAGSGENLVVAVAADGNPILNATPKEVDGAQTDIAPQHFHLRNQEKSLGRKLLRAEAMIGGIEASGMITLMLLPQSINKWPDNYLQSAGKNVIRAWSTPPVWDHDAWAINYIGHPYAGSLYYNSMRSQGSSRLAAFLFSAVQSTLCWEYGIEAVAERPSIQDLVLTPVVGSLMGELSHLATMRMAEHGRMTLGKKILITAINPTFVMNNGFKNRRAVQEQ